MNTLLISRDGPLQDEIAVQGAARVPPLHIGATRASLRDALDRVLAQQGSYWIELLSPGIRHRIQFEEGGDSLL